MTRARRVVHQALALEDRHDAPRHADALEDRRRRDGVGRRDDRAESEGARPAQRRDEHVGDRGDDGRGEDHQAEREQDDRPQVRLELADRREVATREEQRRKEHEEHEIRRKLELR